MTSPPRNRTLFYVHAFMLLAAMAAAPAAAPPPGPPLALEPAPKQDLRAFATLFSDRDYPREAVKKRMQGRVDFRLDVSPTGALTACTIVRSSGHPLLDATTCRILRLRARFIPARDGDGKPVADVIEASLSWRLPKR